MRSTEPNGRGRLRLRTAYRPLCLLAAMMLLLAACGTEDDAPGAEPAPDAQPDATDDGGDTEEPVDEPGDTGAAGDDYYAGATIEILVPFGAGGGSDVTARFLGEWLPNYLEGDQTVVVRNEPGGGGVTGWNEYANRIDRDGMTLVMGSSTPHSNWLYGNATVQYDLNDMEPLIAMPTGNVMYVLADTGITGPEDLHDEGVELFFPGIQPIGGDLYKSFPLDLLEINHQKTWGYEGSGAARVAMEQGEANVDVQSGPNYLNDIRPWVEDGFVVPILAFGAMEGDELVRDPVFDDIPHTGEVYEMLFGEPPSGIEWDAYKMQTAMVQSLGRAIWVHGDAPEEARTALQQAFEEMAEDPAFLEAAEEEQGGYPVLVGESLAATVQANLYDVPDETVDWLANFVRENYDLDIREGG